MTIPEVTQEIDVDRYTVVIDVLDVVLDAAPAVLRALSDRGLNREAQVLRSSEDFHRRRLAAATIRAELRTALPPVLLQLDPRAARDLAEALRDAATAPAYCDNWTSCLAYAVNGRHCAACGGVEIVTDSERGVA